MSKYTVTMHDYLTSEFQNMGYNEFLETDANGANIIKGFGNGFIHNQIDYDDTTKFIVDSKIFHGFTFTNQDADVNFKKAFINRFMNREIKFQTIDIFASRLVSLCIENDVFISTYFSSDINKYLNNQSESNGSNNSTSDSRNLISTLPQSEINLDIDDDVLTYGDSNNISKNKNSGSNQSQNKSYNLNNLNEIFKMKDIMLNEFDKKLFMQIW